MDLETFMNNYDVGDIIGKGPNCIIKRCTNHETGLHYLVKIIDIRRSNNIVNEAINNEVNACEDLKHLFVSAVLEAFTHDGFCYMIYEYLQGADLLVEIVNRANSGFVYSEAVGSHYLKQLLEAVLYLHEEKGIIHGDIRPHCIALATKENSSPLKLFGFKHSVPVHMVDKMDAEYQNKRDSIWISFERDKFGSTTSPIFMAPEVLEGGKISFASDMWSVGCILYMLLVGQVPFTGSPSIQHLQICKYPIKMDGPCWKPISSSARDLIMRLMDMNPDNRISADEALKHPWIKDRIQISKIHLALTVKNLQSFNALRTLKEHILVSAYSSNWSMINEEQIDESNIFLDINETEVLSNGIISQIVESLDSISILKNVDSFDDELLDKVFQDVSLCRLLDLYEDVHRIIYYKCPPYHGHASIIMNDVIDSLEGRGQSSAAICHELQDIALQPHFISLLKAHDVIANEIRCSSPTRFNMHHSELNTPNEQELSSPQDDNFTSLLKASLSKDLAMRQNQNQLHQEEGELTTSVRVFKFFKSFNEPMGITIKMNKDEQCIVSRIIHGGMIHQKVAMKVGDEILEINGISTKGQPLEKLQKLLMECNGNVSLKVLPGQRIEPMHCDMFIRALFNYNPRGDQLIPAENAGVAFKVGDILEVLSKDDENWWQARKWNPHSSISPAGLIPSPLLYEWRTACSVAEKSKQKKGLWFLTRRKRNKDKYLAKHNALFDRLELVIYEEVVRLPAFNRKTLVLLGAHGVGRRHIKNIFINNYREKYAYPIPHTTRAPRDDEKDGLNYYFVSEESMMQDINNNLFLEYGMHENALYGTKLNTIRSIHNSGRIAILDIEPQALKILRCAEFSPFVAFIAAPTNVPPDTKHHADLQRLIEESESLERTYEHFFNIKIPNNEINETIRILEMSMDEACSTSQWVPVNWVY